MPWLKGKRLTPAHRQKLREVALSRCFGKWMDGKDSLFGYPPKNVGQSKTCMDSGKEKRVIPNSK